MQISHELLFSIYITRIANYLLEKKILNRFDLCKSHLFVCCLNIKLKRNKFGRRIDAFYFALHANVKILFLYQTMAFIFECNVMRFGCKPCVFEQLEINPMKRTFFFLFQGY